jgi:hypothetical protein
MMDYGTVKCPLLKGGEENLRAGGVVKVLIKNF